MLQTFKDTMGGKALLQRSSVSEDMKYRRNGLSAGSQTTIYMQGALAEENGALHLPFACAWHSEVPPYLGAPSASLLAQQQQ